MPLANALPLLIQATVSGIVMIRCYGRPAFRSFGLQASYAELLTATLFHLQLLCVEDLDLPSQCSRYKALTFVTFPPLAIQQWNRNKWILAIFLALQAAQSATGAWLVASYISGEEICTQTNFFHSLTIH